MLDSLNDWYYKHAADILAFFLIFFFGLIVPAMRGIAEEVRELRDRLDVAEGRIECLRAKVGKGED